MIDKTTFLKYSKLQAYEFHKSLWFSNFDNDYQHNNKLMTNFLYFSEVPFSAYMPVCDFANKKLYLLNKNLWEYHKFDNRLLYYQARSYYTGNINSITFINNYYYTMNDYTNTLLYDNVQCLNVDHINFLKKYNLLDSYSWSNLNAIAIWKFVGLVSVRRANYLSIRFDSNYLEKHLSILDQINLQNKSVRLGYLVKT